MERKLGVGRKRRRVLTCEHVEGWGTQKSCFLEVTGLGPRFLVWVGNTWRNSSKHVLCCKASPIHKHELQACSFDSLIFCDFHLFELWVVRWWWGAEYKEKRPFSLASALQQLWMKINKGQLSNKDVWPHTLPCNLSMQSKQKCPYMERSFLTVLTCGVSII